MADMFRGADMSLMGYPAGSATVRLMAKEVAVKTPSLFVIFGALFRIDAGVSRDRSYQTKSQFSLPGNYNLEQTPGDDEKELCK